MFTKTILKNILLAKSRKACCFHVIGIAGIIAAIVFFFF